MIRHRQQPHLPGVRPGNCVQVCLASILDEPTLGRIPHVAWIDPTFTPGLNNPHAWWGVVIDTLARYGTHVYVLASPDRQTPLPPTTFPLSLPPGEEIVGVLGAGPSPRGPWGHAVVVDTMGHLIHDPNRSDAGVPFLDEVWIIARLSQVNGPAGEA